MNAPDRRVVAIMTLYRPGHEVVANVASIMPQVDRVVAVDDGSDGVGAQVLRDLARVGADIVRLANNSGIAAALNAGIRAADLGEHDLAVTFDQDSNAPAGFVAALVAEWDRAVATGRPVALVAPATFAGMRQHAGARVDGFLPAREPIQSGTLFGGRVLRELGPFREDLFIDLVDVEYFLRARAAGLDAIAVPDLDLPHRLGRDYAITAFGKPLVFHGTPLTTSLSTPFRYYYRARNRVVVNAQFAGDSREYFWRDMAMELRHLLLVVYFARPAWSMIRLLACGLRDGKRGRMGRIPGTAAALASAIHWRRQPLP